MIIVMMLCASLGILRTDHIINHGQLLRGGLFWRCVPLEGKNISPNDFWVSAVVEVDFCDPLSFATGTEKEAEGPGSIEISGHYGKGEANENENQCTWKNNAHPAHKVFHTMLDTPGAGFRRLQQCQSPTNLCGKCYVPDAGSFQC